MHRIDINLRVSRIFFGLIFLTLLSSISLIATLPLTLLSKILLLCVTLIYGLHILWRHGFRKGPKAITSFHLDKNGWHCTTAGRILSVELSGHSTVTSLVSVICFNLPATKKMLSIVVFRDALPLTLYRSLIVEMRTHRAFKPSQTSLSL
jgi:hypothetical protein